jgi:protein SCO1
MIRVFALCSLGLAVAAALAEPKAPVARLPFYGSADFTPQWTATVPHRIGDFSLVTQTGDRLTRSDLLGRVHVATFVYTTCAGVCPSMVTQLKKLQAVVDGTQAVIVSFSVTPQHDTPATLARFGELRGIDARRWKLVTGDAEQIYELARSSYFADDGRLDASLPAAEQFLHTEKALLVDSDGRLRGVIDAAEARDVEALIADVRTLTGAGSVLGEHPADLPPIASASER